MRGRHRLPLETDDELVRRLRSNFWVELFGLPIVPLFMATLMSLWFLDRPTTKHVCESVDGVVTEVETDVESNKTTSCVISTPAGDSRHIRLGYRYIKKMGRINPGDRVSCLVSQRLFYERLVALQVNGITRFGYEESVRSFRNKFLLLAGVSSLCCILVLRRVYKNTKRYLRRRIHRQETLWLCVVEMLQSHADYQALRRRRHLRNSSSTH